MFNILLYFLYQKDALLKYSSYKRNGGVFKISKDDVLFWTKCLKKTLSGSSSQQNSQQNSTQVK